MAKIYVALAVFAVFCTAHVRGVSDDVEAAWEKFQVEKKNMAKSINCNTNFVFSIERLIIQVTPNPKLSLQSAKETLSRHTP